MNLHHIRAIAQKDIREASANKSVWVPMLVVPLIFVVALPLGLILLSTNLPEMQSITSDPDLKAFLSSFTPQMRAEMIGYTDLQLTLVLMLGYLFAPMLLIIPLMFATTIAAESFAGEKERKTLEALLYSPASDTELLVGKILAAFVPAVGIAWVSFAAYTLVLNVAGWRIFERLWFPLTHWWPMIFWMTPALSLLGVAVTVLISKKVNTFMGAYQSSAATVLLVIGLIAGQLLGVFTLSVALGMVLGLIIFSVDALLMWFAAKTFNRKALLSSI